MNIWIVGDYRDHPPTKDVSLMIADPVYGTSMVNDLVNFGNEFDLPTVVFMWPQDIHGLNREPEQITFWTKPVSTKNTKKRYSNFVEVICFWDCKFSDRKLHWSTRTGIFTDSLLENDDLLWKKPFSLIEKLVLNHYLGDGIVYDPCAGSGTVHDVCVKHGIPSISIEIDVNLRKGED